MSDAELTLKSLLHEPDIAALWRDYVRSLGRLPLRGDIEAFLDWLDEEDGPMPARPRYDEEDEDDEYDEEDEDDEDW